jgi:hypothetical protein
MDGMSRSRQVLPSRPVDFPVYGLDASWPGARWLELFGDAVGDPVRWVALGHRSLDQPAAVVVQTFSRPRTDEMVSQSDFGWTPQQDVAHHAANMLINMTLPEQSAPRPEGILQALANHARERSLQCAQWPLVRWRVDGTAVTASAWRFADGWAAISDAVPGVYLAAIGAGTAPDGLSLAVIHDGSAYHFPLDQPLYPQVLSVSRQLADGDGLELYRQDWHADQTACTRGS